MPELVGIRTRKNSKLKYFFKKDFIFKKGDIAIVDTEKNIENGEVCVPSLYIKDKNKVLPYDKILRKANKDDLDRIQKNKEKEKEAYILCAKKIKKHNLNMKLIGVEYLFLGNKVVFYFTADGRVDFRELVKDLASVLHVRIELRQVGIRDEARKLGGLGICGKPFCCSSFMNEFYPVSIKMAKEQGLSLNPTKISGMCGRLMCCLKFEQEAYKDLLGKTPKSGAIVETKDGKGTVIDSNMLTGDLRVKLDKFPDAIPIVVNTKDIKILKDVNIEVKKEELENLQGLE